MICNDRGLRSRGRQGKGRKGGRERVGEHLSFLGVLVLALAGMLMGMSNE